MDFGLVLSSNWVSVVVKTWQPWHITRGNVLKRVYIYIYIY